MEAKSLPVPAGGSDFMDFLLVDPERLAIAIGDVAAKGLPATLFLAKLVSDLRLAGQKHQAPEAVLAELNLDLATQSRRMFVSAQYLLLDVASGAARVANGGHVPLLWYHGRTDEAEVVDLEGGPPLGVLPSATYPETTLSLEHGDSLFLLTDGVLECANGAGETFGFPRLIETVEATGRTQNLGVQSILRAVEAFTGNGRRHDDLSLVQVTWQ